MCVWNNVTEVNLCVSEDGYWEMWSLWGECTLTCGTGSQVRSRVCVPPANGGATCDGISEETQECKSFECPGKWTSWNYLWYVLHPYAYIYIAFQNIYMYTKMCRKDVAYIPISSSLTGSDLLYHRLKANPVWHVMACMFPEYRWTPPPDKIAVMSQMHFREWKVSYFDYNPTEVCSEGSNWQ